MTRPSRAPWRTQRQGSVAPCDDIFEEVVTQRLLHSMRTDPGAWTPDRLNPSVETTAGAGCR